MKAAIAAILAALSMYAGIELAKSIAPDTERVVAETSLRAIWRDAIYINTYEGLTIEGGLLAATWETPDADDTVTVEGDQLRWVGEYVCLVSYRTERGKVVVEDC